MNINPDFVNAAQNNPLQFSHLAVKNAMQVGSSEIAQRAKKEKETNNPTDLIKKGLIFQLEDQKDEKSLAGFLGVDKKFFENLHNIQNSPRLNKARKKERIQGELEDALSDILLSNEDLTPKDAKALLGSALNKFDQIRKDNGFNSNLSDMEIYLNNPQMSFKLLRNKPEESGINPNNSKTQESIGGNKQNQFPWTSNLPFPDINQKPTNGNIYNQNLGMPNLSLPGMNLAGANPLFQNQAGMPGCNPQDFAKSMQKMLMFQLIASTISSLAMPLTMMFGFGGGMFNPFMMLGSSMMPNFQAPNLNFSSFPSINNNLHGSPSISS
ncbi:MAG: hypothetical protein HYU63_05605 [Armatimonadetes bacterium]|nr:hypothetical protein [Armatimonadota bacterium]